METATAIVTNSFNITNIDIVVELQHSNAGLEEKTILISKSSNLRWEVITRILFDHAVDIQKIFPNESKDFMHLSFDSPEKQEQSRMSILNNEKTNIFQYRLKPLDHNYKPNNQEELIIISDEV